MELPKNNAPVTTVGSLSKSTFSIAMNAKAFRVLSDTLYQNKKGSIVREISCNALDGHIAAGNPDVPFTIHVPDSFEPWFAVRDYGIGLSPSAMEEVFTKYFESTKDSSNDSIGAFGLGAKTPFSYTDQFNVTSVTGGMLRAYSAFIDESGMPTINLMAEVPTDEPNGVEIKIGVKPEDFNSFREEVKNQLRFFKVKPEIINWNGSALFSKEDKDTILFENADIKIQKGGSYGYSPVNLVQGPVGYPLDYSQAIKGLSPDNAAFLNVIRNLGADLFFEIGQIGVTASREGVEYNTFTLTNLDAKIGKARKAVEKWMQDSIATLKTPYEKALFLNSNSVFQSFLAGTSLNIAPAIKIGNSYGFKYLVDDMFKRDHTYTDYQNNTVTNRVPAFDVVRYETSARSMEGVGSVRLDSSSVSFTPASTDKIVFCIRDTSKAPVAKMRHYYRENDLGTLYAITPRITGTEFTDAMIAKLKEELGEFADIIRVSDMPDAPRATYSRAGYARPRAYKWRAGLSLNSTSDWTRVYGSTLDEMEDANGNEIDGKALYVYAERQNISGVTYEIAGQFNSLSRAGLVDLPLVAIRNSDKDKLAKSDIEWIDLETYVKEKVEELRKKYDVKRFKILSAMVKSVDSTIGDRFNSIKDKLHPDTELARLMRVRNRAADKLGTVAISQHVVNILDGNTIVNVDKSPAVQTVAKRIGNVFDKTPLVSQYQYGYNYLPEDKDALNHVVEYINLFGKRGGKEINPDLLQTM